ncbi:hypothetical protein BN2537_81 [Streptomyces venezuelae]|nr:hypothetical protein BN2537_81 [Streptomyces venezuelae]
MGTTATAASPAPSRLAPVQPDESAGGGGEEEEDMTVPRIGSRE